MNHLYKSPESKFPTWIGWVFGVTFSGIIVMSGVVAYRQLDLGSAMASAAGSVAATPAPVAAPATPAPVAVAAQAQADDAADAKDEAPAVAAAADRGAPVAASPKAKVRGKAKRGKSGGKLALAKSPSKSKGKPTKVAYLSDSRRKQILAKHDSGSTRASKQKLDRLLGL